MVAGVNNETLPVCVQEPTIIGTWQTTIKLENGDTFDAFYCFNEDGTGRMWSSYGDGKKNKSFKWSRNGNIVYLYSKVVPEVGEMKILSLDKNNLVVCFEEGGDKLFFIRKR